MGKFIANKVLKLLIDKEIIIKRAPVLVLGMTFKENCSDIRNSKVLDIYSELKDLGLSVDVYDPRAGKEEVKSEYNIELIDEINYKKYCTVIVAVAHDEYLQINFGLFKRNDCVIYDIKSIVGREYVYGRL